MLMIAPRITEQAREWVIQSLKTSASKRPDPIVGTIAKNSGEDHLNVQSGASIKYLFDRFDLTNICCKDLNEISHQLYKMGKIDGDDCIKMMVGNVRPADAGPDFNENTKFNFIALQSDVVKYIGQFGANAQTIEYESSRLHTALKLQAMREDVLKGTN